ncbi:hypothetical protein [Streptomyces sp. NPDC101393]|uniref:hypothetical protein n=1 Tax=Streptomyces sp. NPDC101393 TaxID=3366141 RepID=UPI00381029AE
MSKTADRLGGSLPPAMEAVTKAKTAVRGTGAAETGGVTVAVAVAADDSDGPGLRT